MSLHNPCDQNTQSVSSSSSLGSQSSLGALAVAVVASPQAVKLTEVHVRRDPARLVGLSRLAASLPEQAAVPRAGAGALRLGVGGLEGGCGALTAGEEGGGERWFVGEGGGRGGDGYEGGNRGGRREEGVHVAGGERKERGGDRERTGRKRSGGEREEGGGERERRKGEKRGKFNYGLQDVDGGLAGSGVKRATGAETEARTECRTRDGYRRVGAREEEKHRQ